MIQINPDKSWSLFLDRDGVLNRRLKDDYVKHPEQFEWLDGALEGLAWLAKIFGTIVVVTNQQGIGKGLMTENELALIHKKMFGDVSIAGGRIDRVYYCPDLENSNSFCRKPGIGMGLQARRDFPQIHFRHSVMLGDSISDMQFGKRLNMKTVFISENLHKVREFPGYADLRFESLKAFSDYLKKEMI